ncbi:MAG: protease [Saprospiraceae bacterium]|nr:protease [Saprospiraceae bacterium]
MKQLLSYMASTLLLAALFTSCAKDNQDSAEKVVTQAVLSKIAALGFSTEDVQVIEEGYLVEGCIILHEHDLDDAKVANSLLIAETEQYNTNNLVTGLPRTITVSSSGNVNANVSSAIDVAIARYNAENIQLTFQRVPSGGNINIKVVNGGNYIASAGFPSGGNPYPEVKFNKQYQNWQNASLASVFAHEMGHCIGFRHTDYMNRAYSCGGAASNEGDGGVGANHIPGTPTGPDAASWMLACIGNGIDRPFNANDQTALNYLY